MPTVGCEILNIRAISTLKICGKKPDAGDGYVQRLGLIAMLTFNSQSSIPEYDSR
jgi:hypothetical protein